MLVKLWKLKQNNLKLQQQEQDYEDLESIKDYKQHMFNTPATAELPPNMPNVNVQLLEAMLNKEEVKNKRAYRKLCKISNHHHAFVFTQFES